MSQPDDTSYSAWRPWHLGVRPRLLAAFFGITGFAVLAAVAGFYAFQAVGQRLDIVGTRVPLTLTALDISRSAERIVAAAPALLAAPDRPGRDGVKAALAAERERLAGGLRDLKSAGAQALPLAEVEELVSLLTAGLSELDDLVAQRLEASERLVDLRQKMFRTSAEVQRLLSPWIAVVDSQIAALSAQAGEAAPGDGEGRLVSLVQAQRLIQAAQRQVAATVDKLAEASTTETPERIQILKFQLGLAFRDLDGTAAGLDSRLQPLFRAHLSSLRQFVGGPDDIIETRLQELALRRQGAERLAATAALSARLTTAVDRLGDAAKQDVAGAVQDALFVQRLSTRAMLGMIGLSLLTSVLIVWLYVGRSITRRLVALSDSMLAIAGGKLDTAVPVRGNDEIAAMARAVEVFRRNAVDLERLLDKRQKTAMRLEQLVDERTREIQDKSRQIEMADRYKSHFLASASHDLRQPLYALNLFVAQLGSETDAAGRGRLINRIEAAVGAMNELFESLLDMTKLEAGVLEPHLTDFPIARVFRHLETTFADAARRKNLRLSMVPSGAWVRSDAVLVERILMNLVANALRYTASGGVVVGCRRRGGRLRVDVCDTGPGIPPEQQRNVFGEYYRLATADRDGGGLGLGLAIVERLGRLLDHPVELESRPGRGSRFSVWMATLAGREGVAELPAAAPAIPDPARGKLVVVIDDDPLVREGMGGLLGGWGCDLVTADGAEAALSGLAGRRPDLVISDCRLAGGASGIDAIERLRAALDPAIPAFLISGDTAPDRLRDAREHGFHLLHKPVPPMRLRAMLNRYLKSPPAPQTTVATVP